ncbi:replicative DNA helicase [Streptosporangium sp. KLBMP 9127]|nr:replicative DNA helicase [Streptosporangium sp. KLBMP 9127]
MLLSKDAIADVVEALRSDDFYRPAHQIIYDIVTDLYGRGEPADAITVMDELQKRGEFGRVGGGAYIHTLTAVVPTAANAGYYAKIVREQAILRRLIEAGTRIVSYGYGGQNEEVDELVDRAQAEIYKVTERRTSEDYLPLADIMPGALDEIEAIGSRSGQMVGVPTGFQDLDSLTNGLHPGQMIVVAARPAIGKALALDTPLPTPTGWTTMGEVAVGDHLIGADGKPTRVVAATEAMRGRPCYEVEFSDGTVIVADARHQWRTSARVSRRQPSRSWPAESAARVTQASVASSSGVRLSIAREFRPVLRTVETGIGPMSSALAGPGRPDGSRRLLEAPVLRPENTATTAMHGEIVTTEEIAATLRRSPADARPNHAVGVAMPFDLDEQDLPLPPYVLGIWLGEGHREDARFTTVDPEIVANVEAEGLWVTRAGDGVTHSIGFPGPEGPVSRGCAVCEAMVAPRSGDPVPSPACADCGDRPDTVRATLRSLGVLGDKHIPRRYLRASEEQRRALLAGLLDTDGYVSRAGRIQFAVTNERLANDALELVLSLGYRATMRTRAVEGRAAGSSVCHMIDFTAAETVFRLTRKAVRQAATARPASLVRYIVDVRAVPSTPVRCVEVDNADHMYLASRACIPTHNSTLGLDFARSAAIKHGMTTVVFSLEMSRNEITMRLLSAEARVSLQSMRSGLMNDDDWTRLARRMSEVAEAPLFIDDSPNMSMMEIRAKCRRLKQRNDLRFVIVDYLQLMSSPKKTESRQQEVSEISRAMKLLAKELEVPVIAISQLNRGPEQRTDKRPMVSDLRESGCLTAATRILRADTGAEVSIGDLLASGERDVPVWSLDEGLRLVPRTLTHAFSSGVKEVFRLRLASGREIEATANHPFLTYDGWRPLGEVQAGTRLAVARHVPAPLETGEVWSPEEMTGDPAGVPPGVFALPKHRIARFLRHLWAADGRIRWDETTGQAQVHYASAGRRQADDVARLLLRFNVLARVGESGSGDRRHRLSIDDAENQLRFLDGVGERSAEAARCTAGLRAARGGADRDAVPGAVWDRVGGALAHHPSSTVRHARQSLGEVAAILDDAELEMLATNDVFWDEVASVQSLGMQPVYDATVPGTHNFVANGINVHNSIEQDADMVILLHREDAYERESPRAGEADLIVAKHRNGPTATVTVAFQGHYSRFVDMAAH